MDKHRYVEQGIFTIGMIGFICWQLLGNPVVIRELICSYESKVIDQVLPVTTAENWTISKGLIHGIVNEYQRNVAPTITYEKTYGRIHSESLLSSNAFPMMEDDEMEDAVVEPVRRRPRKVQEKRLEKSSYLRKYIYQIDSTTMATNEELNGKRLLGMKLKIKPKSYPLIYIYHTHGSETYRNSRPGHKEDSVIGVGDALAAGLRRKGIKVYHNRRIYDRRRGREERSKAYGYAADAIEAYLARRPETQVIIDVHRDGVNEHTRLVTTQKNKRMAQIMFFNGMSRTAKQGEIAYLYNSRKIMNLAFSLQLQVKAMKQYPGLTRKIYLKGYRYNLHYRGRSLLVEVGAQNNTIGEAKRSMTLLANILSDVLY